MFRRVFTLTLAGLFALPVLALAQEEEADEGNGGEVLVISQYKCAYDKLDDVDELWNSRNLPVLQELKDEGMISGAGIYYHWWADEWNMGMWTAAEDIPAFMAAWAEAGRRLNERYPDDDTPGMLQLCPEHRDAFYQTGSSTE